MTLSQQLRKAIQRLVAAEIAASWAGSQPPEDHPAIGAELMEARFCLEILLRKVRSRGEKRGTM